MAEAEAGSYELVLLFGMAFGVMKEELHKRLAQVGFEDVRQAHGYVFQLLSHQAADVNGVAEHVGVTKQAASQMLDYLEQHGYVVREKHPTDGRGKLVRLTERGWGCIRETERILSELEGQLVAMVGAERIEQLRMDLRQFVRAFNEGSYPRLLRPTW